MADKKYNPYDNMLSVLKQSAEALGLSYEDYATLCYPERELRFLSRSVWTTVPLRYLKDTAFSIPAHVDRARAASVTIRIPTWTK